MSLQAKNIKAFENLQLMKGKQQDAIIHFVGFIILRNTSQRQTAKLKKTKHDYECDWKTFSSI